MRRGRGRPHRSDDAVELLDRTVPEECERDVQVPPFHDPFGELGPAPVRDAVEHFVRKP
jgi:hypothetical protein